MSRPERKQYVGTEYGGYPLILSWYQWLYQFSTYLLGLYLYLSLCIHLYTKMYRYIRDSCDCIRLNV